MPQPRRALLLALAMIAAGVLAFFAYLAILGHDPDKQPLTLLDWIIGGILMAPGFVYLIQWKKAQDERRRPKQ